MYYNSHCSTRSDGCAPKTKRASSQPPTKRRNSLARAIALALMAGTVTLPISAWAARIEGYKFNDLNNNKVMDANEPGLANESVSIRLDSSGSLVTTQTDSNGHYSGINTNEPKSYTVWSKIPSGWIQTTPVEGTGMRPYTILISSDLMRVDIGIRDQNVPIVVAPPNSAPQQVNIVPSTVNVQVGNEVSFAGSFVDNDAGDIHTTVWNFGDGANSNTLNSSHVYASPGNYKVSLTVTDKQGATGTAEVTVVVNPKPNIPPQVSVTSPTAVVTQVGSEVLLEGKYTDPDDVLILIEWIEWDFGDGTKVKGLNTRHVYSSAGNYTAVLTVRDGHGGVGSANVAVVVNPKPNTAPVASAGKDLVSHENEQVSLNGSVNDPDLNDSHTFEWNFGDGSPAVVGQNASHSYKKSGNFIATLTVKDKQGAVSSDQTEIKVYPSVGWLPFNEVNPAVTAAPPELSLPVTDSQGLEVHLDIPGVEVNELTEGGVIYQQFNLPKESAFSEVGKPQVPMVSRMVAVPKGATAKVEVVSFDVQEIEGYNIYPVQPSAPDIDAVPAVFTKDQALYARNEFFPASITDLNGAGLVRGTPVMSLQVFPVQFNPVTQTLKVYSNIKVKVSFEGGADSFTDMRALTPSYKQLLEPLLLNAETVLSSGDADAAYEPKNSLLIITHPSFLDAANKLAAWKIKKGIQTTVKTTTETGTTAAAIQTYIKNAYTKATAANPPPTYVLFVGDAEFVPTNYVTTHPYYGYLTGTDLYYATVVGTDYFPDIYLGRLSVDTLAQATKRVDDIINYEKAAVADSTFYQKATVAAYFQDDNSDGKDDRRFAMTSEDIALYLQGKNFTIDRVYYAEPNNNPQSWGQYFGGGLAGKVGDKVPDYLKKPTFKWDGNAVNISNAINQGRFLVTHRDHGEKSIGWGDPQYTPANVSALTNGNKLPVVWSVNCETGWFDNETDPTAANTSPTAIHFSEAWERNLNGGAVGVIAATRVSYSGYNDRLSWGWMDAIWSSFETNNKPTATPIYEMGPVLDYGKYYMKDKFSDDIYLQTEFEIFHWFGDPTMEIWTDVPQSVTVSHDSNMIAGTTSLNVTVNITGALVTVSRTTATGNGEILGKVLSTTVTNSATIVPLDKPLAVGDQVSVVVTKHNYRPYESATVTVKEPTPCAVPTVTSNGAGGWTPKAPAYGDIALIKAGHTVTTDSVDTTNLCIEKTGKLISTVGKELTVIASQVLLNQGEIRGADGTAGACPTGSNDASKYVHATAAKDVVLYADKFTNEGSIYGGKGGDDPTWTCLTDSSFGKWKYDFLPPIPGLPSDQFHTQQSDWGAWYAQSGHGEPQYGFPSVGGAGGTVEVNGNTFTNKGWIEAGSGGYGDSSSNPKGVDWGGGVHGTSIGGLGGAVKIIPSDLKGSSNVGTLKSGGGGDVDIPWCWWNGDIYCNANTINPSRPGTGGNIIFNASEQDGVIQGAVGSITHWDPTTLKAGRNTRFEGSDHVEIYGPGDWVMELGELSEGAVSANKTITIAVGKGGVVDLRGITSKVFKAAEKVEIFADHILLDEGVTFADLVDAPVVNVLPAKILYRVALSGEQEIVGKAGTALKVPFSILNSGPTEDTYTLSVTNTEGWSIANLPETVKVNSLKKLALSLDVTVPEVFNDNVITVTATSQGDSNTQELFSFRVMNNEPQVVEPEKVALTVGKVGKGSVTAQGIECGTDCTEGYAVNTEVKLTATPADGYKFASWSGDCATDTLTMDTAKSCTATFAEIGKYTTHGTLKDKAGNVLAGVTVQIGDKTAVTDGAGNWEIGGLVEGKYDVVAMKDNFACLTSDVELGNQQFLQAVECEPVTSLKAKLSNKQWGAIPQGNNAIYTVTIFNGGEVTATGVALNGNFPTGATLVNLQGDNAVCDLATASCTLPDLAPGTSTTLALEIGNLPASGNSFMNAVTLTSNEYPADMVKSWRKVKPYLSLLGKSVPSSVVMGGQVHYQLAAELLNNAPETVATAVKAEIMLPSEVKFLQVVASQGQCELNGNKIVCDLGDLSVASSDAVSRVNINIDAELGQSLVQLNADTKVYATNYPEHKDVISTATLLGDGKVDGIFLLDITASMGEELQAVIKAIKQKLTQQFENAAKPVIAIVTFRDSVKIEVVSDDLTVLLKSLEKLEAKDGGLCPEASAQALDLALDHIKPNGLILFVSDAPPYDGTDVDTLKAKIIAKQVNFVAIPVISDCATNQFSSPATP